MNLRPEVALFGELLLRLSPPANKKFLQAGTLDMHWAGSEVNVAIGLANFGERTRFITSVPPNDIAKKGIQEILRYGVEVSQVRWEGERLGTFYYEPGNAIRNGKIVYDRNYSSFSKLKPGMIDWQTALKDCRWFHWTGINAGISNELAEVCREALEAASSMGLLISADCNHRNALWQYGKHPREIMPALLNYCNLVVADMNVGKLYFDIEPEKNRLVESFLEKVAGEFSPGTTVAMTMRGKINGEGMNTDYRGFMLRNKEIFSSSVYSLENTIERIGSGDAFMSGLIHGIFNKKNDQDVIEFATAAGAYKHTVMGDFNIASVDDIRALMGNPKTGVILR